MAYNLDEPVLSDRYWKDSELMYSKDTTKVTISTEFYIMMTKYIWISVSHISGNSLFGSIIIKRNDDTIIPVASIPRNVTSNSIFAISEYTSNINMLWTNTCRLQDPHTRPEEHINKTIIEYHSFAMSRTSVAIFGFKNGLRLYMERQDNLETNDNLDILCLKGIRPFNTLFNNIFKLDDIQEMSPNAYVVILRDFNAHDKSWPKYLEAEANVITHELTQLVEEPTRISENVNFYRKTLDLFLTSDPN